MYTFVCYAIFVYVLHYNFTYSTYGLVIQWFRCPSDVIYDVTLET